MSEHDESLDALLERHNVQRVVLYRLHGHRAPRWSATVMTGHGSKDDPQGVAVTPSLTASIRAAIAALAGEGDDDR